MYIEGVGPAAGPDIDQKCAHLCTALGRQKSAHSAQCAVLSAQRTVHSAQCSVLTPQCTNGPSVLTICIGGTLLLATRSENTEHP